MKHVADEQDVNEQNDQGNEAEGTEATSVAEAPEASEDEGAKLAPTVEVVDEGAWKRTLKITVSAESVKAEYEDVLKDLGKTVQVPGFRKGHVPRVRLLKQFADALEGDVKYKLISKASDEAMKAEDLEPVGEPEIGPLKDETAESVSEETSPEGEQSEAPVEGDSPEKTEEVAAAAESDAFEAIKLDPEGDFSFQITVEVKPKFEIPEYKGLKLERHTSEVTDERVEEYIKMVRRSEADYVPVTDGGAKSGDRLTVTGSLKVEDETVWEAEHEICHLVDDLLLGLPARAKHDEVEGIAPDEERTFDTTVPDEFKEEAHRGKDAKLTIKVEELKRPEVPPLTDEAARNMGAPDAESLRQSVRTRVAAQAESSAKEDLEKQIVDQLVEAAGIELPEGMLERESRTNEVRQMIRLSQMGIQPDAIQGDHMERIREGAREQSERNLKARLIFEKIAEAENIEITDDDIEEEIFRYAEATQSTPVAVRSKMEREGTLDTMRRELASTKVVNFLVEQADIKDMPEESEPKE
jgi:trigger factor